MYRLRRLFLLLATALIVAPANSSDDFRSLWDAAWRGQIDTVEKALEQRADNHPLTPYLEYAILRQAKRRPEDSDIARFLARYPDTPLARQLRRYWLDELAEQSQWGRFIAFWEPGLGTRLDCLQARAWLAMPQELRPDNFHEQIRDLWLVPHSQPDACNRPFDHWLDVAPPQPQLVWQRIEMAVAADQVALARYLLRFLPNDQHARLDQWLNMRQRPERYLPRIANEAPSDGNRRLLTFGLDRLNGREPDQVLNYLNDGLAERIAPFDQHRIRARAVLLLHTRFDPAADELLASLAADQRSQTLLEWSVRQALRRQDWVEVLARINRLNEERRAEPAWRYWASRARKELGVDSEIAESMLAELAGEAHYYGFLAADQLNLDYALCEDPSGQLAEADASQAPSAGIERALLLYQAGLTHHARREWASGMNKLQDSDKSRAAALADAFGWHHAAILGLANAGDWKDYARRFPILYDASVNRQAAQNGLNPAFVFAVIRAESAFQHDARSPADALGLMQLTEPTARALARRSADLTYRNRWQLIDPDQNIAFGTYYLRRLFDRFGADYWAVIAGYNAGPNIADEWRRDTRGLPLPIILETLPYHETREYVQRVSAFSVIYDWRMGRDIGRVSSRLHGSVARQTAAALPAQCLAGSEQVAKTHTAVTPTVLPWTGQSLSGSPDDD